MVEKQGNEGYGKKIVKRDSKLWEIQKESIE